MSLPQVQAFGGFGVHNHDNLPETCASSMVLAGFKYVRVDFLWHVIEMTKGTYDWTTMDHIVSGFLKNGIKLIGVLAFNNPQYYSNTERVNYRKPLDQVPQWVKDQFPDPENNWYFNWNIGIRALASSPEFQGWKAFIYACVNRYKGKGIIWEIWNEPNLDEFWGPIANPEDYTAFFLTTSRIIKAISFLELVVGPSCCCDFSEYLLRCCKANLLANAGLIDAISHHSYVAGLPETMGAQHWDIIRTITDPYLRGRKIPLICTEVGYSEEDALKLYPVTTFLSSSIVTSTQPTVGLKTSIVSTVVVPNTAQVQQFQAELIKRTYEQHIKSGVCITIVYRWPRADQTYGFVDEKGKLKPVYNTIKAWHDQLNAWGFNV